MPLSIVQIVEFELGRECNLGHLHDKCPNKQPGRYALLDTTRELDDATIIDCVVQAYRVFGFRGFIGWMYYNEPLMQLERMFDLMQKIRMKVKESRFMLWTNGTLIPSECERFHWFEQILISGYNQHSKDGLRRLLKCGIKAYWTSQPQFDARLSVSEVSHARACVRPCVEFIIDNYGNHHLCCYDWRGVSSLGNVFHEPFACLVSKWKLQVVDIVNAIPAQACRVCSFAEQVIQCHDESIRDGASRFIGECRQCPSY